MGLGHAVPNGGSGFLHALELNGDIFEVEVFTFKIDHPRFEPHHHHIKRLDVELS